MYSRVLFNPERDDIWVHAAMWMNHKNILLSMKADTYCMALFIQNIQNWQIHEDRTWMSGCLGEWVGKRIATASGCEVPF